MTEPPDHPDPTSPDLPTPDLVDPVLLDPDGAIERDLAAGRAGDRAALARVLEAVGPSIRRAIAARITPDLRTVIDEDDVMQVTYLEAILRIGRFTSGGAAAFGAWLATLAGNNLRDAIRGIRAAKRPDPRRRLGGANDQSAVMLVEQLAVVSRTPSRVVAREEAVGWLQRTLSRLPPDYERVIRLYDLEGRPIEEVCAALGRRSGAVYMLRARAHEHLASLMGDAARFLSSGG